MPTVHNFTTFLESFAPLRLAEDWDNVGLLIGSRDAKVERVMTCLTITGQSAGEAIDEQADLIVTHHPTPFHALKRITSDSVTGDIVLRLIRAGIAVYSPHTAFDSAAGGINQQWSEMLGLQDVTPLLPIEDDRDQLGAGRVGRLPQLRCVADVAGTIKSARGLPQIRITGAPTRRLEKVGIACGSGGSFLAAAKRQGCDALVTGEATFHTCLEAAAWDVSLLLVGHFASERFACEQLATLLAHEFRDTSVWASVREADPLTIV